MEFTSECDIMKVRRQLNLVKGNNEEQMKRTVLTAEIAASYNLSDAIYSKTTIGFYKNLSMLSTTSMLPFVGDSKSTLKERMKTCTPLYSTFTQ